MEKGKIFFIVGPTAAGKTAIINEVLKIRPNTVRAISYTTREKRPNEVNGKDYFFVTKEEFRKLEEEEKFIEYSEVYGCLYGTTEESFSSTEQGYDVIKIIDCQGAKKFKRHGLQAIYLFFAPKDIKILKERLKKRGDKDIKERLKVYKEELKFKDECNYYVNTSGSTEEDIKDRAAEVISIMNKESN